MMPRTTMNKRKWVRAGEVGLNRTIFTFFHDFPDFAESGGVGAVL